MITEKILTNLLYDKNGTKKTLERVKNNKYNILLYRLSIKHSIYFIIQITS